MCPTLYAAQINVFKPATSKSGNSEQYVVCIGYRGRDHFTTKQLEKLKHAYCKQLCSDVCDPISNLDMHIRLRSTSRALLPDESFPSKLLDPTAELFHEVCQVPSESVDCCCMWSVVVSWLYVLQTDAISENIRYYECMRASEKQFITEVLLCSVVNSSDSRGLVSSAGEGAYL